MWTETEVTRIVTDLITDLAPGDLAARELAPILDGEGRVCLTSAVRGRDNPPFCREGSDHPSAQLFPLNGSGRHLAMYDPDTKEITHVSTCFSTHHLMFA